MEQQIATNNLRLLEFRDWARREAREGLTSENNPAKYVPDWLQRQYWSTDKILEVFQSRQMVINVQDIQQRYIQVLSTLVYITHDALCAIDYMQALMSCGRDDHSLPWLEEHNFEVFEGDADFPVFKAFVNAQWQFCPIAARPFAPSPQSGFLSNRRLDRRQIFPISIAADKTPRTNRISVRPNLLYMNIHSPPDKHASGEHTLIPAKVVFKTFAAAQKYSYDDERNSYNAITNANTDNILKCLGSFNWLSEDKQQSSTIILEYADSGTLKDLFSRNEPPYRIDDIRVLWKGFLGTIYGLETIHNLDSLSGYSAVHQDLKPSNLFLFKGIPESSPYAYKIKIGDFGNGYAQAASLTAQNHHGPDRGGTMEYGPPELTLNTKIDYRYSAKLDMWAFGCIMLETAVWIAFGEHGRREFRNLRMEDTKDITGHRGLGREDCFHDGIKALTSVKDVCRRLAEDGRKNDNITPAIVKLVLNQLLIPRPARATAQQLFHHVENILQSTPEPVSDNHNSRPPVSTNTIIPVRGNNPIMSETLSEETSVLEVVRPVSRCSSSTALTPPLPEVSIRDLQTWIDNKKRGKETVLPGWAVAKKSLANRDFVILVDNSRHMQQYREEVKNSVTAISYLLKSLDRDGIEVALTSEPHHKETRKKSKEIGEFISQGFAGGASGDCLIEEALNTVFDAFKNEYKLERRSSSFFNNAFYTTANTPRKGVSILVFTNGVWERVTNEAGGADRPIQSLIEMMRKHNIVRTQVSIQFVRLGSDGRGIRRLNFLDDDLAKKPGNADYDIVDHKPITASIWAILIGSLQEANDRDNGDR